MSREIEADFIECSKNDEKQCQFCSSFREGACKELQMDVPSEAYCDFFQSAN